MLQVTACGAIAVILERMGQAARPLAASVMAVAPRIWVASEGQNLLRIHVVSVLCKAAAALGPESEGAAPLLLSIIAVTTDVDNPEHVCGNASPTLTLEPQLRFCPFLAGISFGGWALALAHSAAPRAEAVSCNDAHLPSSVAAVVPFV